MLALFETGTKNHCSRFLQLDWENKAVMLAVYEKCIPLTMHTDMPSCPAQGGDPLKQLMLQVGTGRAGLSSAC